MSTGKSSSTYVLQFWNVFKYADSFDLLFMIVGTFGTIGDGLANSVLLVIASKAIHAFGRFSSGRSNVRDPEDFMNRISSYILLMVYAGMVLGVCSYLEGFCWMRTADRQASRMRYKYLQSILQQDVEFFDTNSTSTAEVINSVSADVLVVQDVISQKVPHFIMHISSFIGGYAVAFILIWQLGIITLVLSPILILPGLIYGSRLAKLAQRLKILKLKASLIAEQALSSIRTVFSYVCEEKTMVAFSAALDDTVQVGLKQGSVQGLSSGSSGFAFAIWAVVCWYGSKLVIHDGVHGGKVVAVGLSTTLGGVSLGLALPDLKFFVDAQVVTQRISRIIEHVPRIDSEGSNRVLQTVYGDLELRNVVFSYPARPETIILKNLSLKIPAGKTVALVGSSGCGKSTIIALLERFYDPLAGEVLLDGCNLKFLYLNWLRMQIGLVSQEPALFSTTIRENIAFGKDNSTMEEIVAASEAANAHEFIVKLPDGYNTMVGENGIQVSGGQKQRIAIARAILRNPAMFLLDEATSALDARSELAVQQALENASVGRTTVVIAHRLSTICYSDIIAVVESGTIVESGGHDELLSRQGAYSKLVRLREMACQENERSSSAKILNRKNTQGFGSTASHQSSVLIETAKTLLEKNSPSFRRLLLMNKQEWKYGVLGSIGAVGFGIVHPTYAFFLGNTIGVLYYPDHSRLKERIAINCYIFTILAGLSFVVNYLQHYNFGAMGEVLTNRVQNHILQKVFTFEVGWFDEDENSSAKICTMIATEANIVRSLVADRISLSLQTAAAIFTAFTVGLVVSWRMALAVIAIQPFIMICYYAKSILIKKCQLTIRKALGQVCQFAGEAVSNYRTIAAFSSQDRILSHIRHLEEGPRRIAIKNAHVAGLGYGAAQCLLFCSWAFDYWYGSKLLSTGKISTGQMFQSFFILVSTGRVIAEAASMTSDLMKGAGAVASLFKISDRVTNICSDDQQAERINNIEGLVELHKVDFAYPSRPDILVLTNFSLRIDPGMSMALVGNSGSGKSTVIGLIERFYDPTQGCVKIDGKDIRRLHLKTLRQHIALVSQEPLLFSGTIRENISYGRENATEAEIIEAAKAANAHDFICSMRNGYDTCTGERGVQLSGGQKQRIAIARAIVKSPAILLLDEATSALDVQSEQLIQGSLQRIMNGRTTIIVAHRLNTIQSVSSIAVIQDGIIVEQGVHSDLMSKGKGPYYSLVNLQVQASDIKIPERY